MHGLEKWPLHYTVNPFRIVIIVAILLSSVSNAQTVWRGTEIQLVTYGDSITMIPPGTGGACSPNEAGSYSQVLKGLIAARQGSASLTQIGFGGSSWNYSLTAGIPTLAAYLPGAIGAAAGPNTKLVLFAGTNGLVLGGHTPAQEYADFESVLATILGYGYTATNISVVSMLPRESYSEVSRAAYNALLSGGVATHGYRFVDLSPNFDIGFAGQQNDTNFFCDQIHPTTTDVNGDGGGHGQIAYSIYDVMYPGYPWTPLSAVNEPLMNWYDAQNASSVSHSGSTLTAANDVSGNSRDLSIIGTGTTYAASAINGHPALQFSASGTSYLQASLTSYIGNQLTYFSAIQMDDDTNTQVIWNNSTTGTTFDSGSQLIFSSSQQLQASDQVGGGSVGTVALADTNAHAVSGYLVREAQLAAQARVFLDGDFSACASLSCSTAALNSSFNAVSLRIGLPYQFTFQPLNAKMGETGFFLGRVNAYNMLKLKDYLKVKWGTP